MATQLWNFEINTKLNSENWSVNLTASEDGLIKMMISFYSVFESKLKEVIKGGTSNAPSGLLEELLFVNRCLVERSLGQLQGQHVKIRKVGK